MESSNNYPYHFDDSACKTCGGRCCRGFGGYIWLSMNELERIANTKNMKSLTFSRNFVLQVQGKLSLQERVINGEHFCCFFDPIDCRCTIYQVRPTQCRTFPYWNQFKTNTQEIILECPGVSLKEGE